jgi:hypothetical protein
VRRSNRSSRWAPAMKEEQGLVVGLGFVTGARHPCLDAGRPGAPP